MQQPIVLSQVGESMMHRSRNLLLYSDPVAAQTTLVKDGVEPSVAYLVIKAALVLDRYGSEDQ